MFRDYQERRQGVCRRGARAAMNRTFVPGRNAPAAEYDRSLAWAACCSPRRGS